MKRKTKPIALIAAVALCMSCLITPVTAFAERVSGVNRYETSVKVSQKGWISSSYVVIASGRDYADALCAVPLAKKFNAPVLLTEPGNLSDDVLKEIKRLNVSNIYIAGGNGAVSSDVEKALKSLPQVKSLKRLYGRDRYGTSVAIAKEIGLSGNVVVACGTNYADALSVASIAAIKGMPILLTETGSVPDSVRSYLQDNRASVKGLYVVGGSGVINDSVKDTLSGIIGQTSKRIGGKNRYETNINILREFEKDLKFDNVILAVGDGPKGDEFADALSGAVLAAQKGAPLILTYGTLPNISQQYLTSKVSKKSVVIALGGTAVLPQSVENALDSVISSAKDKETPKGAESKSNDDVSSDIVRIPTIIYGQNPLTVEVRGNNVVVKYNGTSGSKLTLKIYDKGDVNRIRYIDQYTMTDGKYQLKTVMDSGKYTGVIKIAGGKEINLPEFLVR